MTYDAIVTKHTPGPWTIYDDGADGYDILMAQNERNGWNGQRHRKMGDIAPQERKANCKLMAAAPDLLAALEEFMACGPNAGHNAALLTQVRSALEKARGAA